MDSVQLLEQVRSLIHATLQRQGADPNCPLREAMLIRDGFFCGRRFERDQLQAVWFVEENEVKFYDRLGAITQVLTLTRDSLQQPSRKAA